MKYYFYLIIFISNVALAQYDDLDPTVSKLCANVDKIQTLAQIYEPTLMIAASPVPPFTGVVWGMIAKTNVVVDLCNFVNDYQTLGTQGKIRLTKNYTNTLTANKWDDHFKQAESTWNFAENAYDFENGESRPGYLQSAQAGRDISDFTKSSQEYYDRNFNKDARAEQNAQVAELTQVIAQKALINNATLCPETENNPNYKKIYEKEIKPQEAIMDAAVPDIEYFKQKLIDAGTKFVNSQGELYDYIAMVENMEKYGVSSSVTVSTKVEETTKPGRLDTKGKPTVKKVAKTREVQSYSVQLDDQMFQKFVDKYSDQWKSWVKITSLTKTTEVGLFFVEDRLTKELRDISYECRESKLMSGVSQESKGYDQLYEKKKNECENNLVVNEKNTENIVSYFVSNFKNALYKKNKAKAVIWTIESDLLGVNRFSSQNGKNSAVSNINSDNVKCSEELTAAQLDKLEMAQQSNNLKLKEIILKNKIKQAEMRKNEAQTNYQAFEESKRRDRFIAQKKKEADKKRKSSGTLIFLPDGEVKK